mmetsp:Transcript_77041/g.160322  ORF Transcript_77041/g.160322 Transcript_77041/m.160322 type:complete len:234 (+) Transcript_77041:111-812(+)
MATASVRFRQQMAGGGAAGSLHPQERQLVRDHAKDNVKAMREKERQMRGQRLMEAATPAAKPFKLRQFSNAKSRLFEPKIDNSEAVQHGDTSHPDEIGLGDFEDQVDELIRRFGKETKSQQQPARQFQKEADGCPRYLKKIKENMAEQKRLEEAERNRVQIPAGYRQLSADEVAETMTMLKKKHQELEAEFRRLPLKIETDSQKRRQKAILDKIEESQKAMAAFSQPLVLVEV